MPVRKYRSIDEMNQEQQWLPTGHPSIPDKIRYLWSLSEALLGDVGTCIPRGVRKYRSIDEANTDRDRWEQDRIDAIRARNARK